MRLAYLGTPDAAVVPLRALHAAGHEVALVVSRPDARRSRRGGATPSPVKAAATELGLPVSDDPDDVLDAGVELGVVVAYGRILRAPLLGAVPLVNLHFSLLPRWRGAAPVERAILAGDAVTGVCLMEVAEGLDTGAVHACVEVPIGPTTTAADLREDLAERGSRLLVDQLREGLGEPRPQSSEGVTYADKVGPDDLRIDWDRRGEEILRQVRVGGAWTTWRGERFKVHEAAAVAPVGDAEPAGTLVAVGRGVGVRVADGVLELRRVQPAGRAAMAGPDWANGARPIGERLGGEA